MTIHRVYQESTFHKCTYYDNIISFGKQLISVYETEQSQLVIVGYCFPSQRIVHIEAVPAAVHEDIKLCPLPSGELMVVAKEKVDPHEVIPKNAVFKVFLSGQ